MYSEYYTVHKKNPSPNNNNSQVNNLKEKSMSSQKSRPKALIEKSDLLVSRIADRALLLLSFKDTPTQNLHHVLKVLGIHSVEEKKMIVLEIFRLI